MYVDMDLSVFVLKNTFVYVLRKKEALLFPPLSQGMLN
jgi:hypothetical protein